MKNFKLLILLIALSSILTACPASEDGHYAIVIKNNSDRDIAYQPRDFKNGEKDDQFRCEYVFGGGVASYSSGEFVSDRRSWEEQIGKGRYLQFIIMDRDSLLKYPVSECDTLRKYVSVLKTYRLTLEDLKQKNWTINYPE